MEVWGGLILTGGTATGTLKQLYPNWAQVGVTPPGVLGQQIRHPNQGTLGQVTATPDGVHGGTVELWDINGLEIGADVSSGTTITNAQLVAAQAAGRAKLIWSMDFPSATTSIQTPGDSHAGFMRGLAARYVLLSGDASGQCKLNLGVEGGFYLTGTAGA